MSKFRNNNFMGALKINKILWTEELLAWYDKNQRIFPWRKHDNFMPKPWQIWISEVMLQQTTVQTVLPRYQEFMKKWPSFEKLAQASEDDILTFWQGLGYYSRARNLYKAIQYVYHHLDGELPQTFTELKTLPGLGDYSAAAIASIAFDDKVLAIDVNVARVFARFFCLDQTGESLRNRIKNLVSEQIPDRAGDFSQACIELGGVVCRSSNPKCLICPIGESCMAYQQNCINEYPKKLKKQPRQYREAHIYRIYNKKGELLLIKRPAKGLLASLYALPSNDWYNDGMSDIETKIPDIEHQRKFLYEFTHIFTHIHLTAYVYELTLAQNEAPAEFIWINTDELHNIALPTIMKKALQPLP